MRNAPFCAFAIYCKLAKLPSARERVRGRDREGEKKKTQQQIAYIIEKHSIICCNECISSSH